MKRDYHEEFKPIRNRLKKISFFQVLGKLHELIKSKKPLCVPEIYEFIYVNSLIYSPTENEWKVNFKKEFYAVLKETSKLNELIDNTYIHEIDDAFGFMRKMYLNQEKSKVYHLINQFFRYYIIFSDVQLSNHIETKIGISYQDYMVCSLGLVSTFLKKYHVPESSFFTNNLEDFPFNRRNMSKVLDILSESYTSLKRSLKSEMVYDENTFLFHGNQHIKTPIIRYNGHLICLYAEVLLKQATAGMYYTAEIYKPEYNLNNPFGKAFEKYVGIILEKLNKKKEYHISPEIEYDKRRKKTSDWIVIEDASIIFIECKTKRQVIGSKLYSSGKEEEIKLQQYAAKEITKIYKVFNDYKKNSISELPYIDKHFIPIIIFLEDGLYLNIYQEISNQIKESLEQEGICSDIVDEYPFQIFSVADFEIKAQIMFEMGFKNYFNELKLGNISSQLIENFNYIDYFSDELLSILPNKQEQK